MAQYCVIIVVASRPTNIETIEAMKQTIAMHKRPLTGATKKSEPHAQ